jgi:hypothetical protein
MSNSLPTTTDAEAESDGGLIFITSATTPAEFRSKKNMNIVRKQAMSFHLNSDDRKTSKKPKSSAGRSRISSVESDSRGSRRSKLSVGSQDAITDFSTIPTTASQGAESIGRAKATSSSRSSVAPSSLDEDVTYAGPVARTQQPHDFITPVAPLFSACKNTTPAPFDTYIPAPFVSIGKNIDPFRTMFQSSHPSVSVEELKFYCNRYFGTRALGKYWIPTALSYSHTYLGTLCLATAYHDVIHERPLESVQTVALRQEVIHLVGRNMLDPEARVSDHNIMAIIQLIISEVIGREESGLSWHENGIENMIKQRGGLENLGVEGRLASAVSWVSLATSVLREEPPRTIYAEYSAAHSTKQYRPTASLPESPIFCPRTTWKTISKSTKCTPKAHELLSDMRMMIDFLLHETRSSRRNSQTLMELYKKIINPVEYPPVSEIQRSRRLTYHDYKYEAIRIASIIQATAIIRRMPLSEALTHAADLQSSVPVYNTPAAVVLSESLISPLETYPEASFAGPSASPSFPTSSTSSELQQSYFQFQAADPRASMSSLNDPRPSFSSTASAPRPSISSVQSTSSDHIYFPPPPAPAPSNTTTLLKNLRTTIEASNISACWSDMAGVLLWIGLVVGAASLKSESKIHKKYFSALTMRCGVMLCFEHPEAINSTMVRMSEVIAALGTQGKSPTNKDEVAPKRRRV